MDHKLSVNTAGKREHLCITVGNGLKDRCTQFFLSGSMFGILPFRLAVDRAAGNKCRNLFLCIAGKDLVDQLSRDVRLQDEVVQAGSLLMIKTADIGRMSEDPLGEIFRVQSIYIGVFPGNMKEFCDIEENIDLFKE